MASALLAGHRKIFLPLDSQPKAAYNSCRLYEQKSRTALGQKETVNYGKR
jgi:hypothetical protein